MKIMPLTPWYPTLENGIVGIFVKEQCSAIAKHLGHMDRALKSNKNSNLVMYMYGGGDTLYAKKWLKIYLWKKKYMLLER